MDDVTFEWDQRKAAANMRKYKVSFDQASKILSGPMPKNKLKNRIVQVNSSGLKPSTLKDLERLHGYGTPDQEMPEWNEQEYEHAQYQPNQRI